MNVNLASVDRRCWRYRLDDDGKLEKRIFDSPELVPAGQGWVDTPAKLPGGNQFGTQSPAKQPGGQADDQARLDAATRQKAADEAELAELRESEAKKDTGRRKGRKPAADKADQAL